MTRTKLTALLLLSGLALSGAALADKRYPPRIRSDLGLRADPPCQICHNSAPGAENEKSATRPFALVMIQLGLPSSSVDVEALSAALEADESCKVDSDGDGTTDVEELKTARNPSDGSGDPTFSCGDGGLTLSLSHAPDFETGCSVRSGRHLDGTAGVFAALTALALAMTRIRLRSSSFRHPLHEYSRPRVSRRGRTAAS